MLHDEVISYATLFLIDETILVWQFLGYFSLLVNYCDTLRFVVMSISLSTDLDVFSLLDIDSMVQVRRWLAEYDKEVKVNGLWSS